MMIRIFRPICFGFTLFQAAVVAGVAQSPATSARWWSRAVEDRLAAAGTNRTEISRALAGVADARREGMAFLVENMPEADLRSLTAAFLLENLNLAYEGWEKSCWRARVTHSDRDRGWTVELAFPWRNMKWLATDGRTLPPKEGDVWRLDFSRFNTYKESPPAKDSGGWFWTRHGVWDSHIPECFVYVTFSTNIVQLNKASSRKP